MAKAKQEVVKKPEQMIVPGTAVPEYLRTDKPRGSDNVGTEDLIVPRIEIAQALSPCLDADNDAAFIEGAKQGDLFNTLTRELYGSSILFAPILWAKQWLVWRDRKKGGGFRGAFNSKEEGLGVVSEQEFPEEYEAIETGQHLCAVIKNSGLLEEAMLSMARTKLKVSRNLNTLVKLAGVDRFAQVFELTTVKEKNAQGQEYWNFNVAPRGFAKEQMFEQTSKMFEVYDTGQRTYVMDTSDMDNVNSASTSEKGAEY